MKYEKSCVEIVHFDGQDIFTTHSGNSGQVCKAFATIWTPDSTTIYCYDVSYGTENPTTHITAMYCYEVSTGIPGEVFCASVTYGNIIP